MVLSELLQTVVEFAAQAAVEEQKESATQQEEEGAWLGCKVAGAPVNKCGVVTLRHTNAATVWCEGVVVAHHKLLRC